MRHSLLQNARWLREVPRVVVKDSYPSREINCSFGRVKRIAVCGGEAQECFTTNQSFGKGSVSLRYQYSKSSASIAHPLLHYAAMVLLFFIIGIGNVWGDINTFQVSGTFKNVFGISSGNALKAGDYTINGTSWTFPDLDYFAYSSTTYYQFGSAKKKVESCTLSTSAISGTITSVKVTIYGAKGLSGSLSVSVDGTAFKYNNSTTASFGNTSTEYEFTGSGSGTLSVSFSQATSVAIYLAKIITTYSSGTSVTLSNSGQNNGSVNLTQLGYIHPNIMENL